MAQPDEAVLRHYESIREEERIAGGLGQLEVIAMFSNPSPGLETLLEQSPD